MQQDKFQSPFRHRFSRTAFRGGKADSLQAFNMGAHAMLQIRFALFLASLFCVTAGIARAQDAEQDSTRQLRHVVLFKFNDDSRPEAVQQVEDAFRALPSQIDSIVDLEWGTNNNTEGLAKDFTHCFLVTFANEKGSEDYLPHPAHKKFVALLKPVLSDVLVIDYWAGK